MRLSLLLVVAAFVLAGCAATTYRPLETRGNAIFVGHGGSMSVEDGMDIWDYGAPSGRYRVLGVIKDERPGGALAPLSGMRGDVVKKAREVGGQALIRFSSRTERLEQSLGGARIAEGGAVAAPASSTTASPHRQTAVFLVIQYIDAQPKSTP
jgi:hypothetical protein